jgi:hypothetical protein
MMILDKTIAQRLLKSADTGFHYPVRWFEWTVLVVCFE